MEAGQLAEEPQVLSTGQGRVDAGLLWCHPQAAGGRRAGRRARRRPPTRTLALVGSHQAGDDRHEGGLAGAVGSEQADDLALGHVEVDLVERPAPS